MQIGVERFQIAVWLTLFLAMPLHVLSLRCLQCDDCGLSVGDPMTCRTGQNMCMKLRTGAHVERTCGTHEACGYGVAERWGRRFWRHLRQLVQDWDVDEDSNEVFCCATDFCNRGSQASQHVWPIVLAIALLSLTLFN